MPTLLSDEHLALAQSANDLLQRHWSTELVRAAKTPVGSGHDATLWKVMADNGWLGLAVGSDLGGSGGTYLDLGAILTAAGSSLVPATFRTTVATLSLVIDAAPGDERDRMIDDVIAGRRLLAMAADEAGVRTRRDLITARAVPDGDGHWILDGRKTAVLGVADATTLVVLALEPDGTPGFFLVDAETPGVRVQSRESFSGEAVSDVDFESVTVAQARRLQFDDPWMRYRRSRAVGSVAHAASHVGGADEVLRRTIEFLNQREQFGKPLASFQGLRHRIADLATRLAGARLVVFEALAALDGGAIDDRIIHIATVVAADAYTDATLTAHQFHAGIGFAREHDLFLHSDAARAFADVDLARDALHAVVN